MKIVEFIQAYSLDDVLAIEQEDSQNQAIKRAWEEIRTCYGDVKAVRQGFLYILIQTALISYQIAGSGPLWRDEITQKIISDFDRVYGLLLAGESTDMWWHETLTTSRYNKRLYNNKAQRIKKFFVSYDMFHVESADYYFFYSDMSKLLDLLAVATSASVTSKTLTFAIKIFGYGARWVYGELILYPMNIAIPLDSRLRTMGGREYGEIKDADLLARYNALGKMHGIPPLHLDSLLWLEYWKRYF